MIVSRRIDHLIFLYAYYDDYVFKKTPPYFFMVFLIRVSYPRQ